MRFSIKNLFSKCDQIRSLLQIWPHLLKKSLMENFFLTFLSLNLHQTLNTGQCVIPVDFGFSSQNRQEIVEVLFTRDCYLSKRLVFEELSSSQNKQVQRQKSRKRVICTLGNYRLPLNGIVCI